jgi:DNA modification methylase
MESKIINSDCIEGLKQIERNSVQTCITSPPYWQLRDYGQKDQLGTEKTPEEFVARMVQIFREVRDVLRDDGTIWINLGDTFCGGGGYCPTAPSNQAGSKQSTNRGVKAKPRPVPPGFKAKDLVGIPWMVAMALRAEGWYLRADIIWEKSNGMPEAVKDRPTRCHEYVFLLTKNPHYFYNAEAIKEETTEGANKRNKRSVWKINQKPYAGAHFAVFPEELVKTCMLAGSKEGDLVLDPFVGSGTTGAVANKLKRNFIGIDLNPDYCIMAEERIKKENPPCEGGLQQFKID